LLESLVGDQLDPGYRAAADRRAAGADRPVGRSRLAAYLVAGLLVVGLVLGVAAATTKGQAGDTDKARAGLRRDIQSAQAEQNRLLTNQAALAAQIRSAQASLGAGSPLQTVRALEARTGLTAVHGPGLTIIVDESSAGAGGILDRDLQLLVNGLWSAGAETITVGGVRLRTTSAIRQAGSAILVDNRPVFWPIGIEAIGDPVTLHVNFVGTLGFGRFRSLASLYGIRFDLSERPDLTMPAAPGPDLRFATAPPSAPPSAPLSPPHPSTSR